MSPLTIGLGANETCAFFGGSSKPINKATYYRGVKAGRFPAPVHPSPGVSRVPLSTARK